MENSNMSLENWEKLLNNPKLGEILIQHKKITIHQLDSALQAQKELNIPIGQILIQQNFITKDELVKLLDLQVDIGKMLNESFDEIKALGNSDQVSKLVEVIELSSNPDLT